MLAPIQPPFERFAHMTDQVPPVEDVLGLWRAQCGAARILHGAITAEDGDTRMSPAPGSKRVSRAVGPEIKRSMARQVHQQGAIARTRACSGVSEVKRGDVCHARLGNRGCRTLRHGRGRDS